MATAERCHRKRAAEEMSKKTRSERTVQQKVRCCHTIWIWQVHLLDYLDWNSHEKLVWTHFFCPCVLELEVKADKSKDSTNRVFFFLQQTGNQYVTHGTWVSDGNYTKNTYCGNFPPESGARSGIYDAVGWWKRMGNRDNKSQTVPCRAILGVCVRHATIHRLIKINRILVIFRESHTLDICGSRLQIAWHSATNVITFHTSRSHCSEREREKNPLTSFRCDLWKKHDNKNFMPAIVQLFI